MALPISPADSGLSWGGAAGVGLVLAVPIGLFGFAGAGLVQGLLFLGLVLGVVAFVLLTLVSRRVRRDPRRALVALLSRDAPRVVLEVRGETLYVDGEPWPLVGIRRVAFRFQGGHARLELETAFRRFVSPPLPSWLGRAEQAVLSRWLREAQERARGTTRTHQELRDRARAATTAVVERVSPDR